MIAIFMPDLYQVIASPVYILWLAVAMAMSRGVSELLNSYVVYSDSEDSDSLLHRPWARLVLFCFHYPAH